MTPGPLPDAPIERIRHNLVGLRMPRALEALDMVVQQLERGQIGAIEAIDTLLAEEFTARGAPDQGRPANGPARHPQDHHRL